MRVHLTGQGVQPGAPQPTPAMGTDTSFSHSENHTDQAAAPNSKCMKPQDIAIPVLPSRSLNDTLAFYRRVGFEGHIHGQGNYAILTRGPVELHFFTHRELRPEESSAGCYIRVSDVEGFYQASASADLPRKGIPRRDALEDKPWGMREFAIVDPDGNLLRIGQSLCQ